MQDITTEEKSYTALKIEKKPGSEIEITGEVTVDAAHKHRIKAIRSIVRELELPGFRKGHVPEDMAMTHVGEMAIMQETAERAISETYAEIITDEKLDVIGRPNVTITKLASGNPIGFKITSAVFPEVTLPEYKKIATAEIAKHDDPEKTEVTDADIDGELKRLQQMLTPRGEVADDKMEGLEDGEDVTASKKEAKANEEPKSPEINDEFAQQLGDFKDLADLKEKIKKGMMLDKKQKAYEKRRLAIVDLILSKTKIDVPALFIEGELDQMVASFEERVERAGMQMSEYLKQIEKTMDDMRKEWRPDAEKRAKLQLVLGEIAKKEGIKPDTTKLDREVAHLKEHYPEADESTIRTYASSQMANNLVFALLEGRKVEDVEEVHNHEH
ncbi:MAG: hypothetical protein KBD24_03855 [Candidatus Pacebacteria bacterium]|nr:hypothetical protein [Candidatus Paceibacterota bacterium]